MKVGAILTQYKGYNVLLVETIFAFLGESLDVEKQIYFVWSIEVYKELKPEVNR